MINKVIDIFTNPVELFRSEKEDSSWVPPALIIIAFGIVSGLFVASGIDTQAMGEAQMEAIFEQMEQGGTPAAEIEQARAAAQAQMNQQSQGGGVLIYGGAVIGVVVYFFLILLVYALYFYIVSRIMDAELAYTDWLALVSWSQMPMVIASVITVVVFFVVGVGAQGTPENYLSLARYLPLPNENNPMFGEMVKGLDLISIWIVALMAIGFKTWTDKSIGVSLAVAVAPYVVFYALVMSLNISLF